MCGWWSYPRCPPVPVTYDPSVVTQPYPVGSIEYDSGVAVVVTTGAVSVSAHVKGNAYYPAESSGPGTPFRAGLSPVPIIFMAHGNHSAADPSYLGYDYFQQALARIGMVAASVDLNAINAKDLPYTEDDPNLRAQLLVKSIEFLKSIPPGSPLSAKVDYSKVGLMGHSRGGEAVLIVPKLVMASVPGVGNPCILSLAPTNAPHVAGGPSVKRVPSGSAFMTLLPAGDGDVYTNDGAKFYDQGIPSPLKCQLYLLKANHNYFNRQWTDDDTAGWGGPPLTILSRADHERVLTVYGCAFFRAFLLGHETSQFLEGRMLPPSLDPSNISLSIKWSNQVAKITVDDYEESHPISLNSLGEPTSQNGGLTATVETFAGGDGHPLVSGTFYGDTMGMKAASPAGVGSFRSQLHGTVSIAEKMEVWVRVAEIYDGVSVPPTATGFEIGLEDSDGIIAWLTSDSVGGVPRPYDRKAHDSPVGLDCTKTMMRTLRFPVGCFEDANSSWSRRKTKAVLYRLSNSTRPLAFDDLQIITRE